MRVRRTLAVAAVVVSPLIASCSSKTAAAQTPAAFCASLTASSASVGAVSANMTAEQLRAAIEQSVTGLQSADKLAPADIKADMDVLTAATVTSAKSLEKVGYDRTKVDKTAVSPFSTPEVKKAREHLSAYVKVQCALQSGNPSKS